MKVLIASEFKDDQAYLKRMFSHNFPKLEIICTAQAEETINIAAMDGPFAFFIIDCETKAFDPNSLASDLVELTGDRPLFFLGNHSAITDRIKQETFQSNALNDKFLKPLERKDFIDEATLCIEKALDWAKDEEFEASLEEVDPEDYVKMRLKSFYLYKTFAYDIYLEITSTQYIKIISADKPYSLSLLSTYARKNIKYLYIKKDEHLKYLEAEAVKCLKALRGIEHRNKDIYLTLLRSITIFHQYLLAIGVTPSALKLANATTDVIIEHFDIAKKTKPIFKRYPHLYEGIASKSLLTAFISLGVIKKMEWDSITTKKKLSMAAILMDYNLPDESMSKINSHTSEALLEYSEEKQEAFLKHPLTVAEIAKQFTTFPDLDFMIVNHHELPRKRGFPNKRTSSTLTPICAILNISQFVAAELDGEILSTDLIIRAAKKFGRDSNHGNFKEPLAIVKKYITVD